MNNSLKSRQKKHCFSQMQIVVLLLLCILFMSLYSACVTPAKNIKGLDPVNPKNTQHSSQSRFEKQEKKIQSKPLNAQPTTTSGKQNVNLEDTKKHATSNQKSIDSFFGNLTIEERTVLSWLIGGVLGLAFVMLIIKGIISRKK